MRPILYLRMRKKKARKETRIGKVKSRTEVSFKIVLVSPWTNKVPFEQKHKYISGEEVELLNPELREYLDSPDHNKERMVNNNTWDIRTNI